MIVLRSIIVIQVVPNSENPKVVFSLFETVKLSVSISPRNLYISMKSIREQGKTPILSPNFNYHMTCPTETVSFNTQLQVYCSVYDVQHRDVCSFYCTV